MGTGATDDVEHGPDFVGSRDVKHGPDVVGSRDVKHGPDVVGSRDAQHGPLSPASLDDLRDGSPRAFAAFHRAHSPRLYAYLVRLTRDRALADDLFQESWLRLARALPGLLADVQHGPDFAGSRDGAPRAPDLRAFIFAIARNAFLDARRADRRRPTLPLDDDSTDAGPRDDGPSLETLLADRQTLGYLEEVLGTLPDAAREILHLVAFEGMTPQEAAPVLGLTPEATRKRLERARGALAEALTARLRQTRAPQEF
jgi:RNA polymerase sigma-70 factor (ECF subfamily)